MLTIGLTGGIGAGKTACSLIFQELGIPVYNSDSRAKSIMTQNSTVVDAITELFGEQSYMQDGSLNRSHLSSIIFEDKALLSEMNKIVHPAVRDDFAFWCTEQIDVPYILQESALLFETGSYQLFDKIIVVHAIDEIRITRVMERDGVAHEQVVARMSKQLPQEEKIKQAHYTIDNSGQHSIVRQVIDIHFKIITGSQLIN